MLIDPEVMALGFAMGLFIGLPVNLINKVLSAFFRWIMSW